VAAQVGRNGRAVSNDAGELGASWHAINDVGMAFGIALLDPDVDRLGVVSALGVDEVLFAKLGRWRTQAWPTSIVDVAGDELLDVIEGRSAAGLCGWLAGRDQAYTPTGPLIGDPSGQWGPLRSATRTLRRCSSGYRRVLRNR
jgi:hypothetical protein